MNEPQRPAIMHIVVPNKKQLDEILVKLFYFANELDLYPGFAPGTNVHEFSIPVAVCRSPT